MHRPVQFLPLRPEAGLGVSARPLSRSSPLPELPWRWLKAGLRRA